MGLDQYLTKKFYVKNWDHMSANEKHVISINRGGNPRDDIDVETIKSIECEVLYWRKANAIHKWFVDNVQEGIDDCKEYYVPIENIQKLYDVCCEVLEKCIIAPGEVSTGYSLEGYGKGGLKKKHSYTDGFVIKNPEVANDLLPTTDGFFFGGTQYDQYYYEDILRTKNVLEKELAIPNNDADYYYEASW